MKAILIDPRSDLKTLFLVSLRVLSIWLHKFEARITIAAALTLLALCPFALIFGQGSVAGKAAIWACLFLMVGIVQEVVKLRNGEAGR